MKYLKSRTVWAGIIGALLNVAALVGVNHIAGMPIEELADNRAVIASQLTVIAAGVCDLLAIFFRIRAKVRFTSDTETLRLIAEARDRVTPEAGQFAAMAARSKLDRAMRNLS